MPIRPPALDDRRYDDLVAELVAASPRTRPSGRIRAPAIRAERCIELFAWLGDALLYRANLIPERQRLAFLRLLGQPLRAARPARGLVTISLKENKPVGGACDPSACELSPVRCHSRRGMNSPSCP